jgi:hypothetical protein
MALCNNIFGGLVHIPNTATLILNNLIYFVLSHNNQDIQNIQDQRYDDTTNMRGECNGLQLCKLWFQMFVYTITTSIF